MARSALDNFGKAIISGVRDPTIRHVEREIGSDVAGIVSSTAANELTKAGFTEEQKDVLRRYARHVVDMTIAQFLQTIADASDDGEASLRYVDPNSDQLFDIVETTPSLAGELWLSTGWINRHSLFDNPFDLDQLEEK